MTDNQTLFEYRLQQAEETLLDAGKMLKSHVSARSIANRAYYAMFYGVLALFLEEDIPIKTSKHAGLISIFNKEFIHSGKLDKKYSMMLHQLFEKRQEGDYKDFVILTKEDAVESIAMAREFLTGIKEFIKNRS